MRLIDADALKEKFCKHCDEQDCKPDATDTVYGCVIADTIDSMPTIEAEPVNDNWISVEDKLPDKSQKVLAFYKALGEKNRIHNDLIATNWRTNKGDFIPCDGYKVTHWQPLPELRCKNGR